MWGAGYDAGDGSPNGDDGGLEVLAAGARAMSDADGTQAVSPPAAQPGQDGDGDRRRPQHPDRDPKDKDKEEWPDPQSLDKDRLASAHKIFQGFELPSAKLKGWKPTAEKPRHQELWHVIKLREPHVCPKNWKVEKMVEHMLLWDACGTPSPSSQTGTPEQQGDSDQRPGAPTLTQGDQQQKSAGGAGGAERWSCHKMARLLLCILEHKSEFLTRDAKLSRRDLDAKGVNSFWHTMAKVFTLTLTLTHNP